MNIRLFQQQNDTLLSIEADFDKFVAGNFGDICRALARHLRILIELKDVQQNHGVKIEKLIEVIRRNKDKQNAERNLINGFNISTETACFILNVSMTELNQLLDTDYLEEQIDECREEIRKLSEL